MGHSLKIPPMGFETLSVDEQIAYLHALWDHIAAKPEAVPVPDWHQAILDERLADLERTANGETTWDAFRAELRTEDDARKG